MNQARLSTESIIRVVGHYRDMLQGADNTSIYYLNSMAAPMLQNLQHDLQSLQRQIVNYTGAVNPDSGMEYHTIQANTAQAITVAEVYLSSTGLQSTYQIGTQLSSQLPAMVPDHVIIQPKQMDFGNTGEQILSEATTHTSNNMSKESTTEATADNDLNMQTDDEFLQLDVQQEKIDTLYADAMEDLIVESPKTEHNHRDGLNPSMPEPTLPELGPSDIEIIIEAPKEPATATEEIVNKTVRVDGGEQPSGTPNDHKVCCGCAAIGHILESCPEDHGLKLTDCQMHHMEQTNASANKMKPAGTGISQSSVCFKNLAKSPTASRRHR